MEGYFEIMAKKSRHETVAKFVHQDRNQNRQGPDQGTLRVSGTEHERDQPEPACDSHRSVQEPEIEVKGGRFGDSEHAVATFRLKGECEKKKAHVNIVSLYLISPV